jgi:phosphomannomutase
MKHPNVQTFFKAYDLRATTPDLSWEVYYLAGQALITEILNPEKINPRVTVWHDARLSSDLFYKAFVNGLESKGADVVACGLGSTDMMYASALENDCAGAIITASHNPKDDNGLKIVKKAPQMLGLSTGLDKIRDYVVKHIEDLKIEIKDLKEVSENLSNRSQAITFLEAKISSMAQNSINKKGLKVVVDSANGMGGLALKSLIKVFPNIEFIPLYCDIDGSFPNHPADPINPANLVDLQKAVQEHKANLGIAFDGDADRAFFVDELGQAINGENLVAVFAQAMVKKAQDKPELGLQDTVCYVISYSRALSEAVTMANGVPVVCKQGHTFVKSQMSKYKSIYGGEASGHHYFGEFGYMDSGVLAVALMFQILDEKNLKASELTNYFDKKYFVLGETNKKLKEGVTVTMVKELIQSNFKDAIISELDGITVYYPDYKFTLRGSNTEPLLRINIESKISQEHINKIFKDLSKILSSQKILKNISKK